jgi:hypothetical protein
MYRVTVLILTGFHLLQKTLCCAQFGNFRIERTCFLLGDDKKKADKVLNLIAQEESVVTICYFLFSFCYYWCLSEAVNSRY